MFLVSIPTVSALAKSIITDIKDNQSERLKGVENQGRLELDERNKEVRRVEVVYLECRAEHSISYSAMSIVNCNCA